MAQQWLSKTWRLHVTLFGVFNRYKTVKYGFVATSGDTGGAVAASGFGVKALK
jgi:hypothetical protein